MTLVLPRFLLVEPQFVLRRTIATVARNLGVADFQEANSLGHARTLLASGVYQGVVLDVQERVAALALIRDVRLGHFATPADALVVAVDTVDAAPEPVPPLQAEAATYVLRKPIKISALLALLAERVAQPA